MERSISLWLKEGDRNTKFFHTKASQRNRIGALKDDDGRVHNDVPGMDKVILDSFQNIFQSNGKVIRGPPLPGVDRRVSDDMNESLAPPPEPPPSPRLYPIFFLSSDLVSPTDFQRLNKLRGISFFPPRLHFLSFISTSFAIPTDLVERLE